MCQVTITRLSNHFESCQVQKVASLLTEALRYGVLRLFGGSAFWSSPLTFAGFFQQLDISHGSPRDERAPGTFFFVFGVFFFDGFYGNSTSVVADQPSVEAAPSGEPHGYSLSVPLLRQVPGQRASPVRLLSPGILTLTGGLRAR